MDSSKDDAGTVDTWTAAFTEREPQQQTADYVNQQETIEPSCVVHLARAAHQDQGNAGI